MAVKQLKSSLATAKRRATLAKARAEEARANAETDAYQAMQNSYKGGVPTRLSERWEATQGFRFGTEGDRRNLGSARDRAYQAYRDNPVARTLVDTETDNVIGDGLNYQPASSSEAWNREAEQRYYEWLEYASVRGQDFQSGCDLERTIWTQSRVAGRVGWILIARGTDEELESRIQIVKSENIATPDGMSGMKGIYDGVKVDQYGAPSTYYVLSRSEQDAKRVFIPIPARDFVYLSHSTDPDSVVGETCYLTIFDLLSHLDRYVDGVSLAAWMATVFGLIFKEDNASKQLGQLTALTNSQGQSQKAMTLENGMVKFMGTNGETVQVQAHQPMQQTPEFIRAMYRMLGQPFDMPLEMIAKDMSQCTFASARIGLLPFYRSCRIKAARFSVRWGRTIKWWLSREAQRLPGDPKKWKTAFPGDYWNHELLVNAWDYTDPVSEAQADLLQIDMLTKSTPMVIKERGRNASKILRDQLEWDKQTEGLAKINSTMTRHPQSGVGATGDPLGHDAIEPAQQQKPEEKDNQNGDTDKERNGNSRITA